jgi:hypothetical protein
MTLIRVLSERMHGLRESARRRRLMIGDAVLPARLAEGGMQ